MKTFWKIGGAILLYYCLTEVFGQQNSLPDHYPKFLKTGRYSESFRTPREYSSGTKTSGRKTFTKTFTKTGSYSSSGSGSYGSYGGNIKSYPSAGSYMAPYSPNASPYASSQQGGCTTNPRPPMNSHIRCGSSGCNATCLSGYKFPDGQTRLSLICLNSIWVVEKPQWMGVSVGATVDVIPAACEPICEPPCENNGICYEPNRCNCPDNYSGMRCESSRKPCLNYPVLPMNARRTCSTTHCTVTCLKGHTFPDGSAIANLQCVEGSWIPARNDWKYVPDCQPNCEPPCQNGGNCLSVNVCQCPQDFRGTQCQYRSDACTAKRLGFNGGYNCSGDSEIFRCSLKCPDGIRFEFPPAVNYLCRYSTGIFEPQPIPQCLYSENLILTENTNISFASFDGQETKKWHNNLYNTKSQLSTLEENLPRPSTCFTWGGTHFKTFEGDTFSASSDCAHTLVRDAADNTFSVVISNSEGCKTGQQCHRIIYIYLQDKEYTLTLTEPTIPALFGPGGKRLPLPGQVPGLRGSLEGHHVVIVLDSLGVSLKWDTKNLIQVQVSEALWNKTEGLCGNNDNSRENEIIKSGLGKTSIPGYMDKWKINILGETCSSAPRDTFHCSTVSKTLSSRAHSFCTQLLTDKRFAACLGGPVDASAFLQACQWDYCACADPTGDPSVCACETIEVFVEECRKKIKNVEISRWRDENTCPMKCTGGRIYTPCASSSVQPTCGSSSEDLENFSPSADCHEGCYCPQGTVLHAGKCITPDTCPCLLRGREFSPGAQVPKECNTCTCENGQWKCTALECGARCSAIGDPHYQTFDGRRFDFMGQCNYYLVKSFSFSIEAENVACAGAISHSMNFPVNIAAGLPSCTRSLTIRTSSGHVIKLKQNLEVLVDGHDVVELPHVVGDAGDVVRQASSLFVVVELENGVEVWWDGVTRVYVDAPAALRDKTRGLCGTFNSNQKDDFLTPEGDIEQDPVAFANKWKVNERCEDVTQPKHAKDHPCQLHVHNKEKAEKYCGVIHSKLFSKCHWLVDPQPYYEDCLFDMCSCETQISKCLCGVLGAYATSCAALGAGALWREEVPECGISCPSGQTYQTCSNSCTRSCSDISSRPNCKSVCVEGCNCPEGEALDEKGECIPVGQCPCQHDGVKFPSGYKEIRQASLAQEVCVCSNAGWVCHPASKSEISELPKASDRQTVCSVAKNQEFTTCEPEIPVTCRNMHDSDLFSVSAAVCRPGCKCRAGFVLKEALGSSGLCVRPTDCPCHHGGKSYKENEVVKSDCNNCTCQQGSWECTKHTCASVCTSWGDSHFTTFDGRDFDYQGHCDYVLTKGSLGKHDGFEISVQNVPCGSLGVSCSKSVTISIANEAITLTKDKPIPDHQVLRRMSLRQTDLYVIIEAADLGLSLLWDKGTRVSIRAEPRWKGRLKGLCGNYNDDQNDDFQTPSGGFSEVSPLVFGDSWRINPACPKAQEVQNPCDARPERRTWAVKKCGVLKGPLFAPCHAEVPVERFLDRCVFDTCACDQGGDCECLCAALGAYAQECNNRGVHIKWRSQKLCPLQCDERCSQYSPCISSCPLETCDNLLSHSRLSTLCSSESCVEGCAPQACPEGQVHLNSTALECVPRATCKPICMEIDGLIFSEGDLIEEDACHKCYCSRTKKVCTGKPCELTTTTVVPNDAIVKCLDGWTAWINQDTPKNSREFKKGKKIDIEPLPTAILLNSLPETAKCQPENMVDIQCRTVDGHIDPKATGLDVECSLERGLVCKSDRKTGIKCPDFEIRVLCNCNPQLQTAPPPETVQHCDISTPNRKHDSDCHSFYHCVPSEKGFILVEKTCGPSMWYNPQSQICDWPDNVIQIRPNCSEMALVKPARPNPNVEDQLTGNMTICPPGYVYSDCGTECTRLCMFYNHVVREKGLCLTGSACEAGCIKEERQLSCPSGFLWRDNSTCVKVDDCVCRAHDGTPVKPGTLYYESDCELCQCISNHYTCDRSACTTTHPTTQPLPSGATAGTEGPLGLRPTETPPEECPENRYSNLLEPETDIPISDAAFSASGVLNEAHQPWHARLGAKLPLSSAGAWAPLINDQDQYLQVDLGRVEPIYGVILLGNPIYDNYVTSFQLLYSSEPNANNFRYAMTKSGLPQLFRGSVDQRTPVKAFLDVPIEARYIRINPKTWHNEISIRLDVIGCAEEHTTTPKIETTTVGQTFELTTQITEQLMCDQPMGVDSGQLNGENIYVSSEKDLNLPSHGLGLNSSEIWRPLANTPNEFVKFDFTAPRQLTGVVTHGGPQGWVSAYQVEYSHDDFNWNPVVDDFGNEKLFPANFDQSTVFKNMFDKPIRAQYLRILPKKWTSSIQMATEPLGCFEPYPELSGSVLPASVLPEIDEPVLTCQHCPGVEPPASEAVSGACLCDGAKYWDGAHCIPRAKCPCKVGLLTYEVGTVFEKEDCSECLCALGGVSQCSPQRCPPCEGGLRSAVTATCGCVCKPCPVGEVLCPTSNICINQTSWCDNIVDCPDDEVNCQSATTIEPILTTKKAPKLSCPPVVCPPGFKISLKQPSRSEDLQKNLSPMFHMYGGRKTKMAPNKMAAKYYGAKGRTINSRSGYKGSKSLPRRPVKDARQQVKQQVCVEFVCEPPQEVGKCQEPRCPPGYTVVYAEENVPSALETLDEQLCQRYECHPPPVRDDICNITGRSFNTFDGVDYKYDICNHVIARDLFSEDWDVILVKNCSEICSRDLLIRHGSQIVRIFSDLSVEFNGYRYTAEQTAQIGARNLAFVVSRMGDTLLFVSNHYGFWIMWNRQANVKLGVTEKLLGQVDGLCGFYDKNPKNDKRKPNGKLAKTTVAFGEAWLLEESKPQQCEVRTCPLHVQNQAFEMCQSVRERILAPCTHAIDDLDGWISRCLETSCACLEQAEGANQNKTGEEKCRCNVLEAFVVECTTARPSVELEDWRMQLECPASCDAPLVHHDCYRRRCEPSCSNLAEVDACPTLPNLCFPGCYCPAGLVRKKDKCVAPRECRDCECNVLPHLEYVTYDGANHTANTNCTYLMARDKTPADKDRDFEVYVTNGPCVLNPGKMCTRTLTMIVNKHRIEIRRGESATSEFQVAIDDFPLKELPFDNGWAEVSRLPTGHVTVLIPKLQVEFRAYYPTLGASLKVPSHSYGGNLEGICGDCDRNPENDNIGPENQPILNDQDFVTAWQVHNVSNETPSDICVEEEVKDCLEVKDSNGNDPCLVLLDADRFGQCHMLLDPQIFLSTCWHDTCGGHPEAACSSLETYAMGCRAQGLCIDYHTEMCPARQCPQGSEYALCGAPCVKTCDIPKGCTKGLPKEGCFCPEGLVLKNGTECVEERECFPCDDLGHFPGDSWTQDACTRCECDVTSRSVRCETRSCPAVDTVCEEGFEPVKIKKSESECCEKYACVPANTTKPECEDPKPLLCGEDQIRKLEKRPDGCLDYVCQCKPPSECPDLTQPTSEPLPVGMERVLNDSGCCPRENLVCKADKCPRAPSCAKYHTSEPQNVPEGFCCPEYKCIPPSDKCLFTKSHIAADKGGERPLSSLEQDVILLIENETLSDGPCRHCKCERSSASGSLTTSCTVTECPSLSENSAAKEYVLEEVWIRGHCCPTVKKTACKFNDGIRKPGERWPLDPIASPCTVLECLPGDAPDSDVSLTRHVVTCDTKCKPGSEYQPPELGNGECCGQCKQVACVVDGMVKEVGKEWTSEDFCKEYKCLDENGTIFVSKKEITCPKPADDLLKEFTYSYRSIPDSCCGVYEAVACFVNGASRHIGSSWPDPGGDPCVTVTCLHSGAAGSELVQQRTVESCNRDCRPGWKYTSSGAPDICCGACTQVGCVSNGTVHLPGDKWASEDGCTTYECTIQSDGSLTTSVNQETCPETGNCPPENLWQDGCCLKCNLTVEDMKNCEPVAMPGQDTVGLVEQVHPAHGVCRNPVPLDGFTECKGLCSSGTFYNQRTSSHESSCRCCQAVKYVGLTVELLCPDGHRFKKQVAVPSQCTCDPCASAQHHTKSIKA